MGFILGIVFMLLFAELIWVFLSVGVAFILLLFAREIWDIVLVLLLLAEGRLLSVLLSYFLILQSQLYMGLRLNLLILNDQN
jgi:hypothetical protein